DEGGRTAAARWSTIAPRGTDERPSRPRRSTNPPSTSRGPIAMTNGTSQACASATRLATLSPEPSISTRTPRSSRSRARAAAATAERDAPALARARADRDDERPLPGVRARDALGHAVAGAVDLDPNAAVLERARERRRRARLRGAEREDPRLLRRQPGRQASP